ncbi:MAG: malate dehydrogenase [Nitrososphaerota archaeon]|nr:malate dehydrogenase [Candidatus Bathyarchaeota archaeon]MDW8048378.1 malate dehydrogenase [Nitrososphaerota archaeon]
MDKVAIVGVGNLGSCIAYEVANRGIVDELVLIDLYKELAEGHAEDIAQAIAFRNDTDVFAGDYSEIRGAKIIVVAAGKPRTPDMKSRMELLESNRRIIESVASEIKSHLSGKRPIIITLTNPVDVMNYLMQKATNIDRMRVIGSAGMLDSSRFRTILKQRFNVQVTDIETYVIGEHGEHQVPLFSHVKIKGEKKTFDLKEQEEILREIKSSASRIISKKGATIFAPANNTVNMIEMILKNEKKICICSVLLCGEYGLRDVSIGVPVILGPSGVEKILEYDLSEVEKQRFIEGANYIKAAINDVLKK